MTSHTKRALLPLALFLLVASPPRCVAARRTPAVAQAPAQVAAAGAVRVEKVAFESRLTGESLPYSVVLPAGYDAKSAARTRYPVLYLLHGLGGSANDWVSGRAHLTDYASHYSIIIVAPEGKDGWYTDGVAPNEKFESYFVEELMPDVQGRFRTVEAREGRAVAGLSMGGYGALKFGLKYPDKFVFAASMSGALAAASWVNEMPAASFIKPSILRVFGPAESAVRASNDIYRAARELPAGRVASLPFFYLDCGTEDPFFQNSRDFAAVLLEKKIAHEYRELPGTHGWPYWDRQVQEILRIAAQKLAPPTQK